MLAAAMMLKRRWPFERLNVEAAVTEEQVADLLHYFKIKTLIEWL